MAEQPKPFTSPYAGLLDLLPAPAALVDPCGRFLYRNAAHRRLTPWTKDPPLGLPSTGVQRPLQRRAFHSRTEQTGGAHLRTELLTDQNGAFRHSSWLCLPLRREGGAVEHFLMVEFDDPAGPESRPGSEEVFDHLETFIDDLVQEIRSPLAAIVGLADSLARRGAPDQTHLADLILRSTQQLIRRLDLNLKRARKARPPAGPAAHGPDRPD